MILVGINLCFIRNWWGLVMVLDRKIVFETNDLEIVQVDVE